MGKLLDLLQAAAGEHSLSGALGRFFQEIAASGDENTEQIAANNAAVQQFEAGNAATLAGRGLVPDGSQIDVGQNPDNSIVVNENDVQVNPALQSAIVSNTANIAALTPTVTSNAATIAGSGISPLGGFGYLTQTAWFVNSATGSDTNSGTTAGTALKTLAELARRWSGHVYSPAVSAITITLSGTFPTEYLILEASVPGTTTINIVGDATMQSSGSVTAYTAFSPSTGVRAALTDGAQDFTTHVRQRIRMTSGAANNGITWIGSLGGGVTIANVGQFYTRSLTASPTLVNPGIGDTYVIETIATVIAGYSIRLGGRPIVTIENVDVTAQAPAGQNDALVTGFNIRMRFFGCRFNSATAGVFLMGNNELQACADEGASGLTLQDGNYTMIGCCLFGFTQLSTKAACVAQHNMHDGNAVNACRLFLGNDAYLEDINHRGFFGCLGGAELITIEDFAQYAASAAAARFWGTAGNTSTNALRVRNGCGFSYVTKPTAMGVAPGADVVLASGAAIAWAAVPAIAAAPDNAFVNVRQ